MGLDLGDFLNPEAALNIGSSVLGVGSNLYGPYQSGENSKDQIAWQKEKYGLDDQRIEKQYEHDLGLLDINQANTLEELTLGNEMDMSNQKEMFDYRISQGRRAGMTAYEMFMGPAAGAGGGTSNSGATLGNAANQRGMQVQQLNMQRRENQLDRETDLARTMMQANAQLQSSKNSMIASLGSSAIGAGANVYGSNKSADASIASSNISAGASRYQTDMATAMKQGQLNLSREQYENMLLPAAQAQLKLTKAQTEKALNEIATSKPEFVRQMKKWSMGVENMMTEYFATTYGIDITNPESIKKIPQNKRKEFLAAVMGFQSNIAKESAGIKGMDAIQTLGTNLGKGMGFISDTYRKGWKGFTDDQERGPNQHYNRKRNRR